MLHINSELDVALSSSDFQSVLNALRNKLCGIMIYQYTTYNIYLYNIHVLHCEIAITQIVNICFM